LQALPSFPPHQERPRQNRLTMPGSDFDVFVRSCRRALRDVVREQGRVPPKVDMVSRGSNPRRLEIETVTLVEYEPVDRIRALVVWWG
jgi:hypothetical protein